MVLRTKSLGFYPSLFSVHASGENWKSQVSTRNAPLLPLQRGTLLLQLMLFTLLAGSSYSFRISYLRRQKPMEKTNLSYPKGQFINLVNRDKGVHVVQEEYVVQNGNKQRQGPVDHRSGQMRETSQRSQPHVGAVSVQLPRSPPFQMGCLLPTPATSLLGPIHRCSCMRENK